MRANPNKRRQTQTSASKRRGENVDKRKQTRANVDKRKQTLTPPFIVIFYTPFIVIPVAIPLLMRTENSVDEEENVKPLPTENGSCKFNSRDPN